MQQRHLSLLTLLLTTVLDAHGRAWNPQSMAPTLSRRLWTTIDGFVTALTLLRIRREFESSRSRRRRAILERVTDRHVVTIQVTGRPAIYATAHENPWKDAVDRRSLRMKCSLRTRVSLCVSSFVLPRPAMQTRSEIWTTSSSPHSMRWKASLVHGHGGGLHSLPMTESIASRPARPLPGAGEDAGARIDIWGIESLD